MGEKEVSTMPYDKRNDDTGRFDASYSEEDFIDALRAAGGGLTTQEVREAVGCAYRTAHARLTALETAGRVASRDVGRAKLWTAADGDESTPDAAETPVDGTGRAEDAADAGVDVSRANDAERDAAVDLADLGLDPDQQAAVAAMRDHLRAAGTAQKADFTGDVYPEHPAGYGSADGWWNALGTGSTTADSKGALADVGGVEKPPSGRPTWTYTGE
jgi:hypothetical protein